MLTLESNSFEQLTLDFPTLLGVLEKKIMIIKTKVQEFGKYKADQLLHFIAEMIPP